MIVPLNRVAGCRLATSAMKLLIADGTIIGPHPGPRRLVRSAERVIGLETGPRRDTTGVIDDAHGPRRRLAEIDVIAALVHAVVVLLTEKLICPCPDDLPGTFRTCRFWFWKKLIGESFNSSSFLSSNQLTKRFSNFVFLVENSFRNRGLRVDVLVLGPRIPLNAAVQRQITEGVLAVVRLSRPNQFSRKIPLQVFDRTGGPDNLRFNGMSWPCLHIVFTCVHPLTMSEYPELEPNLAAEIVFHAQTAHRGGPPPPFTPATPFGMPPLPPAPVPQQPMPALSNPPNVANMITSLDGSTLQSLLSALQPRPAMPTAVPQQPFPPPNTPQAAAPADLASLLSNAAARPPVTTAAASQPAPLPGQQFPVQAPAAPVVPDPNLLSLLSKGLGGQQPQNQTSMGPHVQNIINQLTKWKQ